MNAPSSVTHQTSALPRSSYPDTIIYRQEDLKRADESPDSLFYSSPRFVQHIDDAAIARLKEYYGQVIQPGTTVVDVCSSWTSHLPGGLRGHLKDCVGYGLNEQELARNPHLTSHVVRDLNVSPVLSEMGDSQVNVAICNVSIDYLTRPIEIVTEMRRILQPGGSAHLAFSNRCFPTKVIGNWLRMSEHERTRWVGGYFWKCGGWEDVEEVVLNEGGSDDPLWVVRARKAGSA